MTEDLLQLTWNISAKEEIYRQKLIVTTQMLLNSNCFDMLVLYNECVVRFAVSLFACNVPSELKKVVPPNTGHFK